MHSLSAEDFPNPFGAHFLLWCRVRDQRPSLLLLSVLGRRWRGRDGFRVLGESRGLSEGLLLDRFERQMGHFPGRNLEHLLEASTREPHQDIAPSATEKNRQRKTCVLLAVDGRPQCPRRIHLEQSSSVFLLCEQYFCNPLGNQQAVVGDRCPAKIEAIVVRRACPVRTLFAGLGELQGALRRDRGELGGSAFTAGGLVGRGARS